MSWPGGKKIVLVTVKVYTRKTITTPKATVPSLFGLAIQFSNLNY
jgi:hypothetical protein